MNPTGIGGSSGRFQKGNQLGRRFQPGESGNPTGRSAMQRRFEEKFYRAIYDDKLFRQAMTAFRKAIRAGEAWALSLWLSKGLPQEALKIEVAPDVEKLRAVIIEALDQFPEAKIAVARRLYEVGKALDVPYESVQ